MEDLLAQINALKDRIEDLEHNGDNAQNPQDPAQVPAQVPAPTPNVSPAATPYATQFKPPKPDKYNGGKGLHKWLFDMENYFLMTGIPDSGIFHGRLAYIAPYLSGAASDWWRYKLVPGLPQPYYWKTFQDEITARFQPLAEADVARQKLRRLRQRDSIRSYVTVFNETVLQISAMDEGTKVDNFLFGLKPDSRRWVRQQKPVTLEQAMARAEEYEAMEFQDRANEASLHKRVQERSKPRDFTAKKSGDAEPMQLGNVSGKQGEQKRTAKSCFNCGKPGHLARDCRLPRKSKPSAKVNHAQLDSGSESEEN